MILGSSSAPLAVASGGVRVNAASCPRVAALCDVAQKLAEVIGG